uniref:Uncharacterized protein TCIL3000_6_2670 n=1 Tax=Trypanosoma congolense (strain IL3000) TaxID=1068625 RepID=G0UNR4_TRYCI|nr:unnamed protein product [Trypanosoma congolense IL3000]
MSKKSLPLYSTLGVNRDATREEISRAYRSLAMQLHPDRPGGNREKFDCVQKAYEVLSNEVLRADYDAECERRKSRRLSFKRPPDLCNVVSPVYYKLADGELYTFESSVSQIGCTFRHGDIISFKGVPGCFVGLAGDDFYYWCRDGHKHATKLCQRGSFGVGSVEVLVRANFKTYSMSNLRTLADAPRISKKYQNMQGSPPWASGPKSLSTSGGGTFSSSVDAKKPGNGAKGPDNRTESELLRLAIIREDTLRRITKRITHTIKEEAADREYVIEEYLAEMEDLPVEFDNPSRSEPLVVDVYED